MAKYTTQIRTIVASGINLFDFDYPIFDPSYKSVLETKIIDYYYYREIGLETVGQFKQFLKSKMNRIMPYYNEYYTSNEVFKTYDPYKNKDVTTDQSRNNESDSSSSSTSKGDSKETFSDTPQSKLAGEDYATNITDGTSSGTGSSSGKLTSTEQYTEHIHGHDGMKYPTDILMGLRATFINIDQMVIDELSDLFMNIY